MAARLAPARQYAILAGILVLWGLLACASAGCPAPEALQDPAAWKGFTRCKVLVVGGGAGGLFSAYMLRELGKQVCLVERDPFFGGKLQAIGPGTSYGQAPPAAVTRGDTQSVVGTAGLWIAPFQKDMRCLASRLGIVLERTQDQFLYSSRGRWVRDNMDDFLRPPRTFNVTPADGNYTGLFDRVLDYLFGDAKLNPITGRVDDPHPIEKCGQYVSVMEYIIDTLGIESYNWIVPVFDGQTMNLVAPLDVCGYIAYYKGDGSGDGSGISFMPRGGWKAIMEQLRLQVAAAGVQLLSSTAIECLYSFSNNPSTGAAATSERGAASGGASSSSSGAAGHYKYAATTANGKGFLAERLIFASGPLDVKKLGGNVGSRLAKETVVNAMYPTEVAVYTAFYPSRFWEKYSTQKYHNLGVWTDEQCSLFSWFPGVPQLQHVNGSRPVYCADLVCLAGWKALHASGGLPGVRKKVQQNMQATFPREQVPAPYLDFFKVYPNGWHFLGYGATDKGITINSVAKWATAPLGDPSLCMVGEAYRLTDSGWTRGAWLAAASCITGSFKPLLSPKATRDIAHISSGCSGAETFPKEVQLKKSPLPGLNPATGQQLKG